MSLIIFGTLATLAGLGIAIISYMARIFVIKELKTATQGFRIRQLENDKFYLMFSTSTGILVAGVGVIIITTGALL